ncbi:MAG: hypothetical protein HOP23_16685 [Methylococcaceae bacterium]|nr:hypothetical protein [Methylococcaceae bacterium]
MSFQIFRTLLDSIKLALGRDYETRKKSLRENTLLKQQKAMDNAQISYELEALKIKFSEQLQRIKAREARTTLDYKEFLEMIDEMKVQIIEAYPDMPKVMALVIHQHAKRLIDDIWNNPDEQMQSQCRAKLSQFIQVVYDDTTAVLFDNQHSKIPSKTLYQIEKQE